MPSGRNAQVESGSKLADPCNGRTTVSVDELRRPPTISPPSASVTRAPGGDGVEAIPKFSPVVVDTSTDDTGQDHADDHQLLTVDQLAHDWLRCSRATTYELILAGAIQSVKIGRMRRVPVAWVRAFVASLIADADGLVETASPDR